MPTPEHTTVLIQRSLLRIAASENDLAARAELVECSARRIRSMVRKAAAVYPGLLRWEEEDDIVQRVLYRVYVAVGDAKPAYVGTFFIIAGYHVRWSLISLMRTYFGPLGIGTHHQTGVVIERKPIGGDREDGREGSGVRELRMHEAVDDLPEDLRDTLHLRSYAGLPVAAVASELGVSDRTVSRRMERAHRELARILAPLVEAG